MLRGIKAEPGSRAHTNWQKLTKGNTYTTTLHCINSTIVVRVVLGGGAPLRSLPTDDGARHSVQKLGKLTKVQKVYRGISGGVLPDEFWEPNEFEVRGGVEFAFTST